VDVPGCLSIGESGKKATAKKLVFLVDFQTRANEFYREAAQQVHDGGIGQIVCGESRYPWGGGVMPAPKDKEDRLRLWYCEKALSGDYIVEQNIHTLDVATWFLNADPVKAVGASASKGLRSYGNIKDCYSLTYWFPENVLLNFSSVQCIPGTPNSIDCRVYGKDGLVETDYYTHVWIRGKNPYKGGEFTDLYGDGAKVNIKEFHQFVTEGKYANPTVAPSVRSNLTCVLGRTAGEKAGQVVTWEEMIKAGEKLEFDLSGFKS
jgi:myo-inositol 2-dehydrogenase / D-chiro-inositol 1-dehydrogenase